LQPPTPTSSAGTTRPYWSSWRPITAIRLADTDGNPATDADPASEPLLATPPSQSTPVAFTAFGAGSGTSGSYTRLSETSKEIIDARVYARIHFRTADVQGRRTA
jgi:hypothetical protein